MKQGVLALIVRKNPNQCQTPRYGLETVLSDPVEIDFFERSFFTGLKDPLSLLKKVRLERKKENDAFSEYVETLLSRSVLPESIRSGGLRWFKILNQLEKHEKKEQEVLPVLSEFAFLRFLATPEKRTFFLKSKDAKIEVKVFILSSKPSVVKKLIQEKKVA